MPTQIHLSADPNGVARDFTRYLLEQLHGKKHFTIALSGGSTPKLLFRLWATEYQDAIDWSAIHFFWGDERCVQPDDDESNFGMTKALLFDKVNLPVENIHRVRGEDEPEKEARRYAAEIADNTEQSNGFPSFDLVILGMGDDGHTASIFPHEMELLEEERFCAVATHPTSGQKRVSITGPVINNAQRVAFLVTGANKEEKVSAIFQRKEGYHAYPAAHVQPVTGALHWFLDDAAMY